MKNHSFLVVVFLLQLQFLSLSQVFGPNNPNNGQNLAPAVGNSWTSPGNVSLSDNTYASVLTAGTTNSLIARNFGFALQPADVISGIQLDVERKGAVGANIQLITPYKDGENGVLSDFMLNDASNRLLVVFVGMENGTNPTVENMSYGGRSMTRLLNFSYNTSFWAATECWYLNESELSTLSNVNHTINVTYSSFVRDQFFDIISAALFSNVDQSISFGSVVTTTIDGGGMAAPFSGPISAGAGGMYLTSIFCGNPSNAGNTTGTGNNFTINSGFIEGTDIYRSNVVTAPNSGGCLQTSYKIASGTAAETPIITFNGSPNRRLMIGLGLKKITSYDQSVRLRKVAGAVGNSYANTALSWPLTDTYETYGGPSDMWGTSWNSVEVNNNQFGAEMAINIINGEAYIDNMRVTIYTVSTLPLELISFFAERSSGREVKCSWITATEYNTSHFEVERSKNGIDFSFVGRVEAAGFSTSLKSYEFLDISATGDYYYRLKQFDINGEFTYSELRFVKGVQNEIVLAPNPTNGWFTVLGVENATSISILNTEGKVIDCAEGSSFSENYTYNLTHETDGTYFLVVEVDGIKTVKKLVKSSK